MKKASLVFIGILMSIPFGTVGCQKMNMENDLPAAPKPAVGSTQDTAVDYALSKHWQAWTHHPIWGDASFDNFKRMPGNPIVRGKDGLEWPVNGWLFKDPVSKDWFLYVGWYPRYYTMDETRRLYATVYRSSDKGKTWQECGEPLTGSGTHIFEGEIEPFWSAPDVMVSYKDGRYHMVFDWGTKYLTWENIGTKDDPKVNSGVAYAVADSPTGPFKPVVAYAKARQMKDLYGKLGKPYGPTLFPRKNDWFALSSVYSKLYLGRGLVFQTAPKPEGPWTEPELLFYTQMDDYFPQTCEFYPEFSYDGYIYATAYTAAANRAYHIIFRAPTEKATDPDAWELYQEGSVWHAEPFEWEYDGLWGQPITGFVDDDGMFYVIFPSRDPQNRGTMNLAYRPWNKPFRDRGFVLSAHPDPSMSVLKHDTNLNKLSAELTVQGTVQIIWAHDGPFGAYKLGHGTVVHPLMQSRYDALELTEDSWKLVKYAQRRNRTVMASGVISDKNEKYTVEIQTNGKQLSLKLNGKDCWKGAFNSEKGRIGLWTEKRSHTEVTKFEIQGDTSETSMDFLYTEALQGTAQYMGDWELFKDDDRFRYGEGVISKTDGKEVKWNFIGDGFAVWAPTGPDFGKGEIWLDGQKLATIDFSNQQEEASRILYENRHVPYGRHGVKLKVIEGRVPIDILEAYTR